MWASRVVEINIFIYVIITAAFVADGSPNRKQFPRDKSMELDTGNYLTQCAGFHERDLASVKNFSGKDLPL